MCTRRGQQKEMRCLTKVSLAGLAAVAAPAVRRTAGCLRSGVQGAGFGNRCHQILVVSIPPAPPADFGLAAACDHRPVTHVPAKEALWR